MCFKVFIFGKPDLRLYDHRIDVFADDLFKWLAPLGWLTDVKSDGTGWNVDLWLDYLDDDFSLDEWIRQMVRFLREWGVPTNTCFTIFPSDSESQTGCRSVVVFS